MCYDLVFRNGCWKNPKTSSSSSPREAKREPMSRLLMSPVSELLGTDLQWFTVPEEQREASRTNHQTPHDCVFCNKKGMKGGPFEDLLT
jgi:hypothetical protein